MAYTDIFESIPIPTGVPRDSAKLMRLGLNAFNLASNERRRKTNRLAKEQPVESSDGRYQFPVMSWQRRVGGVDVYASIIDKRSSKSGVLLTVLAGTERPGFEVVKVFAVNDEFMFQGLKRVVNQGYPEDVAANHVDDWQRSVVKVPVDSSPSTAQRNDYARALASIYL